MVDPREISIHTDQFRDRDRVHQGDTEVVPVPYLHDLVHHPEGEEDGEIALEGMVEDGEEVRAIAVTAVMMIGAEAAVVDGEDVADVNHSTRTLSRLLETIKQVDFTAMEFGIRWNVGLF